MMSALQVERVSVALGGTPVVREVSFSVAPGEVLGVVGPNGSGKSTLLRAVLGVEAVASGSLRLGTASLISMAPRERARQVAAVLQDASGDFDLSCRDVVAMGRSPHKRLLAADTAEDARIIAEALELVNAGEFVDRSFSALSGGERQRVLIARAIAQQPGLLIMDEPTNHLDVRNQFDVLALPRTLGVTAVIALHDLNLAAEYCDRMLLLDAGRVIALGSPAQVLEPEVLEAVYGVAASVTIDGDSGHPFVRFRRPVPVTPAS